MKMSECDLPYYYENLNRTESELILQSINRSGCFLIRKHQFKNSTLIESPYVLSLINPLFKIIHFLLYRIDQQYLFIKPNSQEFYHSIEHFVQQHQINSGLLPCHLTEYPIRSHSNHNTSLIIPSNQITREQIIGQGHFGVVYKGLYNNDIPIAIKTICKQSSLLSSSDQCEFNLFNEAQTMFKLDHPYLIHLYGISRYQHNDELCLITEYISNGSLLHWLQQQQQSSSSSSSLTCCFRHRLQLFAFQICDAMNYLQSKAILHRDLAARNCLIDDQANLVKLGDFGMARLISSSTIYEGRYDTPFPLRWSSPEVLLYRQYSFQSDIWSYGILLWEIYSLGQIPFGESISNDIASQLIQTGQMPSKPSLASQLIYEQIITPCWIFKPNDRPSFASLKEILHELLLVSSRVCSFH